MKEYLYYVYFENNRENLGIEITQCAKNAEILACAERIKLGLDYTVIEIFEFDIITGDEIGKYKSQLGENKNG